MIVTVTMNPAVDKTLILDELKLSNVNRVSKLRLDAGGKGINVSKQVKALGGLTTATGFLGGPSGAFIREQLDALDICHHFIEIEGSTRTNTKLVDLKNSTYTDINEPGISPTQEALSALKQAVFSLLGSTGILVLSGSVPDGVDRGIYAGWIKAAKTMGVRTVLDADGALLKEGVQAGPYLVKPNIHELERLFGLRLDTVEKTVECARRLLTYGTEHVVVSMGEKGSVFLSGQVAYMAEAVKTDVKSTVGAGDSMVGGLAYAMSSGMLFEEGARLAAAAATGSVGNVGTLMASREQADYWMGRIKLTKFEAF